MYLWQLDRALHIEMGVDRFVEKARRASLSGVWIKIADGPKLYRSITDENAASFAAVCNALRQANISIWGWHVPHCSTMRDAEHEANFVLEHTINFGLDGLLMDAERGRKFFRGDSTIAEAYASRLRDGLLPNGKGLAISSHDIPANFEGFPFDSFAKFASVNAPQVYYGSSPSVENRLSRAIDANSHLTIPFVPVGAGWIGDEGGCESASACAERAAAFTRLVRKHAFEGYSFWYWEGAPAKLWQFLFEEPA